MASHQNTKEEKEEIKSTELLHTAEERYDKAKQSATTAIHETKEVVVHGLAATKDAAVSAGQAAAGYAKQAVVKAKDATLGAGETVAEYTKQGAVKAKDVTVSTGQTAAEYAKQGIVKAKDATVSAAVTAADYAREKTAAAVDSDEGVGEEIKGSSEPAQAKEQEPDECIKDNIVRNS